MRKHFEAFWFFECSWIQEPEDMRRAMATDAFKTTATYSTVQWQEAI